MTMHDDVISALDKIIIAVRELKNATSLLEKACEKCIEDLVKQHNLSRESVAEKFCANCKVPELLELLKSIPYAEFTKIFHEILSKLGKEWSKEFDDLLRQFEELRKKLYT